MTGLLVYCAAVIVITPFMCLWLAGARRGRDAAAMPPARSNVIVHRSPYDVERDVS